MSTVETLEKSAIWLVENPITDEQIDFILDETERLGQCYYEYMGRIACMTSELIEGSYDAGN